MIRNKILAVGILVCGIAVGRADTFTFLNTNAIVIKDSPSPPTVASPYPATNFVSGVTGAYVTKVTVQIKGFTHTFPSDVAVILVAPGGQNSILFANVGGTTRFPVTDLDLTLDDDAASGLPLDAELVSGTYRPTTNTFVFDFPAPAPSTNDVMGAFLGNFNSANPNGTWNLYVVDDYPSDSGFITGGWGLTITTAPLALTVAKTQTNAVLSWTNGAGGYVLQATPSLTVPAWTNVGIAPVLIGGNYFVTNAMTNRATFYRLAK